MPQYNTMNNTPRRPRVAATNDRQPLPSLLQLLSSPQPLTSAPPTLPPLQYPVLLPPSPDLIAPIPTYSHQASEINTAPSIFDDFSRFGPSFPWHSPDPPQFIPPRWNSSPVTEVSVPEYRDEKPDLPNIQVRFPSLDYSLLESGNMSLISSDREHTPSPPPSLPTTTPPSTPVSTKVSTPASTPASTPISKPLSSPPPSPPTSQPPLRSVSAPGSNPISTSESAKEVTIEGEADHEMELAPAFPCRFCDAGFDSRQERKAHVDSRHPRPHKCATCSHAFTRKFDLEKHILTVHERLRPFRCDRCRSSFGQKHHLLRHKNSVHFKAKLHKCAYCSSKFSRKEHLENHSRAVHKCYVYICTLCDKGCNERAWLVKHLQELHSVKASKIGGLVAAANNCEDLES